MSLTPFEGSDVLGASIRITRAGDGLSTALAFAPVEYHRGDRVFVLLDCEVGRVSYDPIKDTECLQRVHTLVAGVGTIVDGDWAETAIEEQRKRNLEAAGVKSFDFDGTGDDDPELDP